MFVIDPSGTKPSVSLGRPSTDGSIRSDASPVEALEIGIPPPLTPPRVGVSVFDREFGISAVGSIFAILFGTEPSKEGEDVVPSFSKYGWSPSIGRESFSLAIPSSDV